jgi:hypothetical protein
MKNIKWYLALSVYIPTIALLLYTAIPKITLLILLGYIIAVTEIFVFVSKEFKYYRNLNNKLLNNY